jgi:hypothetical protein
VRARCSGEWPKGKPDELVDAGAAQLVDAFCDGLLVTDEGGILRAGVALVVEHGSVGAQPAADRELFGGVGRGRCARHQVRAVRPVQAMVVVTLPSAPMRPLICSRWRMEAAMILRMKQSSPVT